ncbi:MAG: hypothetical protein SCALA702_38480 [Melioribacteraceae bacterium]|nr:MAG: hypothetical protein SCALA702_38480 [Melioribacteraceae bacterium]
MTNKKDKYSAPQQALGYMYQPRYALHRILMLPEDTTCLLEADDDIDYNDPVEGKLLASLKHKAPGDKLTDLSPDFWKSVRIWATFAIANPNTISDTSFFLFTTGEIQIGSFLSNFLAGNDERKPPDELTETAMDVISKSDAKLLKSIHAQLTSMGARLLEELFSKITIFDCQERIDDIPSKIMALMRAVRPQHRKPVFERLEGWWNDQCVNLMTGKRSDPLLGSEVSEMLAHISEQFRDDNLPLDFFDAEPEEGVDPERDNRIFVHQLREIGLRSDRIRRAILDYYRAYEQRSSWARENITITGEVERYDDRLVDEWQRLREVVCEELEDESPEEILCQAGRKIYTDLSSGLNPNLRIRPQVTESYVTVGSYHILANEPSPRVYWHPQFLNRIQNILEEEKK